MGRSGLMGVAFAIILICSFLILQGQCEKAEGWEIGVPLRPP